jgi:hypothetical protein
VATDVPAWGITAAIALLVAGMRTQQEAPRPGRPLLFPKRALREPVGPPDLHRSWRKRKQVWAFSGLARYHSRWARREAVADVRSAAAGESLHDPYEGCT